MPTNSKCDPMDYMTRADCDRFHDAKTEHYAEVIRESRADRQQIHQDLELLESRIIGREYFDTHIALLEEKLKPVWEAVGEFKNMKWWLVKIAFGICLIVGGGVFLSYHYGNGTKATIRQDLEQQRYISTTNCNALRAVLMSMGKDAPSCDFERAGYGK